MSGLFISSNALPDSAPAVGYRQVGGPFGLKVDVYHITSDDGISPEINFSDILKARRYALTNLPDYSFINFEVNEGNDTSTEINLKSASNEQTSVFLGNYANSLASKDYAPLNRTTTIIRQFGFFEIAKEGTYQFNMPQASDGAAVFLGGNGKPGTGNLIIARNGRNTIKNAPGLPNPLNLDFLSPDGTKQLGWYPIEIIYIEKGGSSNDAVFKFSISGPDAVNYKSGKVDSTNVATFVPLHRYSFNKTDLNGTVIDSGVADTVDGKLVGDAVIREGSLMTSGSINGGAQLNISAITRFFHGSFTLEDWFTRNSIIPNKQTLFSLADNDQKRVVGLIANSSEGAVINIDFSNGIDPEVTLLAPAPAVGKRTLLSVSYDGATNEIDLYINGVKKDSSHIPSGLSIGDFVKQDYLGISGLSPFNDPSLNGSVKEFRMYRVALTAQQIAQDFHIGPDRQTPVNTDHSE